MLIPMSAVIANDQDNKKLYLKTKYVEAKKRQFLREGQPRDLAFINSLNKELEGPGYYDTNTALP